MDVNKLMVFNNYAVYYVIGKEFSYYLSVPHNKDISYHMAIDLDKYVDILSPNINKMNEDVRNIYKDIDNTSMVLILPNIDISLLNNLNDEKDYLKLARLVTKILNNAHRLLTSNKFIVGNSVFFVDDEKYNIFINYFSNKFKGRVGSINVFRILKEYSLINQGIKSDSQIKKISVGSLNYIVGRDNYDDTPKSTTIEIKNPYDDYQNYYKEKENDNKKEALASSGNVSYLLLGVISVVLSLILLILFMKK